jgi:hypothetical protein
LRAAVYHLWWHRSAIKHGKTPSTEEQTLRAVVWDIKHRISWKGRFKKSDLKFALCESWGIGFDIHH